MANLTQKMTLSIKFDDINQQPLLHNTGYIREILSNADFTSYSNIVCKPDFTVDRNMRVSQELFDALREISIKTHSPSKRVAEQIIHEEIKKQVISTKVVS